MIEETENIDASELCKPETINAILAHRAKQGHNIRLIDGHMRNVDSMLIADILLERTAIDAEQHAYCRKLAHNRAWVGHALGLNKIAKTASTSSGESPQTSEALFIAVSLFGLSPHHVSLLDDATVIVSQATLIPFAKTMEKYSQYIGQLRDAVVIATNNLDRWEIVCKRLNHGEGITAPNFTPPTPIKLNTKPTQLNA